jgi:uncharacterized protein (DUF58 family)
MASGTLLDREFLERLERLTIHWQKSFSGLVGGHNRSRFAGPGQEFLDHRNFHHGDDLRAVNWRAYLRLEKLFLKMFQVEPRVPIRLLLDSSASMASDGGRKFDYARRLAGALCYIGLVRLDSMEIFPFTGRLGQRFVSSGGRHRFGPVADGLNALEPAGSTDCFAVVREFMSSCPQRGLIIVISDFLDDRGFDKPLQFLADDGHELMLLQIWAEEDRTPPWLGELELVDAESGEHVKLQVDEAARRRYTRSFDAYAEAIQQVAVRSGGRYAGISTAQPLDEIIFGPLLRIRGIA